MAGFISALSASLVLMLMMSVGYFMGHKGWMGPQEKKFVSRYVMNIAVPLNCIVSILNNLERHMLARAGLMLISAYLSIGVTMLLSVLLANLLKLPWKRWGVFVCMTGLSNTLFIGIPVCTQLFGDACLPFLMVYWLGNTTYLQSAGIMLVKHAGSQEVGRFSLIGFMKDLLTKPPVVGVIIGVTLMLLDLQLPGPIMKFAGYISATVSPLALLYCGMIIYDLGLKNVRLMRGLPTMLVVRLVVAPVICLVFCRVFGTTGLARDVFVIESALPVVTQATVMAGDYGADVEYAATGACLSTLGSFITIPILMVLLG